MRLQFIHESINALTKAFDFSLYDGVESSDLEPIVEACKLFIAQVVNLSLAKEQVRAHRDPLRHFQEDLFKLPILASFTDSALACPESRSKKIHSSLESLRKPLPSSGLPSWYAF